MTAQRLAGVVLLAAACGGGGATTEPAGAPAAPTAPNPAAPPAPAPPAPAPVITRCGDLAADAIAGIRVHADEATVRAAMPAPPQTTPPKESFDGRRAKQPWYSTWTWPSHDLEVQWVSLDAADAPRAVYAVGLGPRSELTTTCGVHIGAHRADVERAYADAIAEWNRRFGQATAQGMVDVVATPSQLVLVAADSSVLGLIAFEDDRVTQIAFMHPEVLYLQQF